MVMRRMIYWNTGTMLSLRNQSKNSARQGSLVGRRLSFGRDSHETRGDGSFLPTSRLMVRKNLLGYWNIGTLLSPRSLRERLAKICCLAGRGFYLPLCCERGVTTAPVFNGGGRVLTVGVENFTG